MYVQPVTQHYKRRIAGEVPLQSIQPTQKVRTIRVPQLSMTDSKVKCMAITLCYTVYTNEDASAINPVTSEIQTIPVYRWEAMHCTTAN